MRLGRVLTLTFQYRRDGPISDIADYIPYAAVGNAPLASPCRDEYNDHTGVGGNGPKEL